MTSGDIGEAVKIGAILEQAKQKIPHGGWKDWLDENYDRASKTAQRRMRLYRNIDQLRDALLRVADRKGVEAGDLADAVSFRQIDKYLSSGDESVLEGVAETIICI